MIGTSNGDQYENEVDFHMSPSMKESIPFEKKNPEDDPAYHRRLMWEQTRDSVNTQMDINEIESMRSQSEFQKYLSTLGE